MSCFIISTSLNYSANFSNKRLQSRAFNNVFNSDIKLSKESSDLSGFHYYSVGFMDRLPTQLALFSIPNIRKSVQFEMK